MLKKVGEYEFTEVIGQGSYGNVFKAIHEKTRVIYAAKMIQKSNLPEKVLKCINREIGIIVMFNHKNIIKLHDLNESERNYYLIFEYANGGDLNTLIQKKGCLPESSIRNIAKQIINGLDEIYEKNAIHRDIKLSNILLNFESENDRRLNTPTVKIGDFGFARIIENERAKTAGVLPLELNREMSIVGTPLNMAPELFRKSPYSIKADIWSLGTCIFEMATGQHPFRGIDKADLFNNIEIGDILIPKKIPLSKEFYSFINKCLQNNSEQRISWADLKNHEFLKSENYSPFNYDEFKLDNPHIANKSLANNKNLYYFSSKELYNFEKEKKIPINMSTNNLKENEEEESKKTSNSYSNSDNDNIAIGNDKSISIQMNSKIEILDNYMDNQKGKEQKFEMPDLLEDHFAKS